MRLSPCRWSANTATLKVDAILDASMKRQLLGEFYVYPAKESAAGQGIADRTSPLKVKKTLDTALLKAGVPFLTGTHATEPLIDSAGKLSGVVIANRSGRQAIKAKVVIDATERGLMARAAGGQATPSCRHLHLQARCGGGRGPACRGSARQRAVRSLRCAHYRH